MKSYDIHLVPKSWRTNMAGENFESDISSDMHSTKKFQFQNLSGLWHGFEVKKKKKVLGN